MEASGEVLESVREVVDVNREGWGLFIFGGGGRH